MRVATRRALLAFDTEAYMRRVLALRPIAYWPLDERMGTVARDVSGNGFHGAYTGIDLGQAGIGDGRPAPFFDGANDYVNVYSAGLAGAFNGAEGTLLMWLRVANAGVWTDGELRFWAAFRINAGNRVDILKSATANTMEVYYSAGGVTESWYPTTSPVEWTSVGLTWSSSGDEARFYLGGAQSGITRTTLGTWTGVIPSSSGVLGARTTAPNRVWHGWLAHAVLCDRALTPAEMADLAVIR